ncbi:unnamed protein product [Cuscuta campestris]|uniref:F-box domain-containing protein n=1 Tax=Cuscuta campestris TaxID=132261 RepID=A0A484KW70_9ASTE|nr:unnamed protein product [Cuscuta campestris]
MTKNAGTQSLPEYLIRDILRRLEVKSLIRFQCVSKQWKTLINAPSFIAEHLRRQSPCLLFQGEAHRNLQLRLLDRDLQAREMQVQPSVFGLESPKIVGSSNGLLCLRIEKELHLSTILLWNPAIRELRITPRLLGRRSWKSVDHNILEGIRLKGSRVIANGVMFWHVGNDDADMILSFDIAMEVLTLIPFPVVANRDLCIKLAVYGNKLAMLVKDCSWRNSKPECIDLWVMDEGDVAGSYGHEKRSWTKKCNTFPCKGLKMNQSSLSSYATWCSDAYGVVSNESERIHLKSDCVTANGAMFWHGAKGDADMIVSFDMATEVFTLIPLPVLSNPNLCFRLAVYEKKLAMLVKRGLLENSKSVVMWVMDKGDEAGSNGERWSWTEKCNTTFPCEVDPLRIWKHGIVCNVIEYGKSRIALFNVDSSEFNMLVVHDSYECFDYVESLVPFRGKEVECNIYVGFEEPFISAVEGDELKLTLIFV